MTMCAPHISAPAPPPEQPSLQALWDSWARSQPTSLALLDARDGSAFSRAELDGLLRSAAAWLGSQGLSAGDRFVLVGEPELEVLLLVTGALLAGVVPVVLHPGSPAATIAQAAAASNARLVVDAASLGGPCFAALPLSALPLSALPLSALPATDPNEPALILFSSGSTGPARGVVLSLRGLLEGTRRSCSMLSLCPGDRVALPAAFHTITGLRLALLGAALTDCVTVLLAPDDSPAAILDAARRHHAAVLHAVPGLVRTCTRAPHRFAPLAGPALRTVVVGGGGLSAEDRRAFATGLGVVLVHTYGLTETAGTCAAAVIHPQPAADQPAANQPAADPPAAADMGTPMVPIEVLDSGHQPVPAGRMGRLWLAPAPPMLHTLSGHRPTQRNGRAWVDSGDLGWLDAEGRLHVQGRAARTFTTTGGDKVQLEALEDHIRTCAGVGVVVCVLSSPGRTPQLAALLEREDLSPARLGRLQTALGQRLPPTAIPTLWAAAPQLPRLPGGKPDLAVARQLLQAAT